MINTVSNLASVTVMKMLMLRSLKSDLTNVKKAAAEGNRFEHGISFVVIVTRRPVHLS
jgi:hypothetical protein